jgi:hypothetical protein
MKTRLFFCSLLLVCCQATAVSANDGWWPWAYYGWGYPSIYYNSYQIPYYALYPPVYYSRPVPRTYGDSPYPYPPGLAYYQAPVAYSQPQIIKNDHVDEENPPPDQQARVPLRVANPYVVQSDKSSMSEGIKRATAKTKPSIVHPALIARRTNSANQGE